MGLRKDITQLCNPALFYFVISAIGILISLFQNLGNSGIYTLGHLNYQVPSTVIIFLIKIIYVIFWTWILNLICKDGHNGIAWLLVFFPLIIIVIAIIILISYAKVYTVKQKRVHKKKSKSPYYIQ